MTVPRDYYLTRAQSRAVDEIAIGEFGMLGLVLMENAGRNCAEFLQSVISERANLSDWPIVICCGKGNNGGDGLVIARHLANAGLSPLVLLWANPHELTGDAAANYAILEKMKSKIVCISDDAWDATLAAVPRGKAILIDALLGTGAKGEPREPFAQAIAWINTHAGLVFAIDLPSGLDADTGCASRNTIKADYTLTFVTQKTGFRSEGAEAYLGDVQVIDIGVPRVVMEMAAKR
jgi:NAD(P)H-hydrate epimerase